MTEKTRELFAQMSKTFDVYVLGSLDKINIAEPIEILQIEKDSMTEEEIDDLWSNCKDRGGYIEVSPLIIACFMPYNAFFDFKEHIYYKYDKETNSWLTCIMCDEGERVFGSKKAEVIRIKRGERNEDI